MTKARTRDWSEDEALEALSERLTKLAPNNAAPIPIAAAYSKEQDGHWYWTVNVHVRIPRVTEYEVEGQDKTLPAAIRRAYLALNAEPHLRRNADATNRLFGVTV